MKHTDIVEGIIESQHRGVYDDIYAMMESTTPGNIDQKELVESIKIARSLYHILEKRRRKEGKITFESTEIYFDFDNSQKESGISQKQEVQERKILSKGTY